jgi:nucleoside-diphosphate-sugar epimerase
MFKNVLIVGSQGYLGSRLTEYLNERGYKCSGIDTGFFEGGKLMTPKRFPTVKKDARLITERDLEGFDAIILLAGISNDPFGHLSSEQIYNPTRDYAAAIAALGKKLGIQFIYPSSCSVYGASVAQGLLSELSTTNPQTAYSINKLQVEEKLSVLADQTFSPVALRFATVYGMSARIRFDVVINMLCGLALTTKKITLNSNGQAWRPNLHIDDACESFRCCLEWENNSGRLSVFNVGRNEDNYKIIDIARIIEANVEGAELRYLDQNSKHEKDELIRDRKIQDGVDTRTYKVSFDKIHETLPGFKCKWNLETGILNFLEELRKVPLDSENFNRKEFYRLQQIEFLHQTNLIDDNLMWVN